MKRMTMVWCAAMVVASACGGVTEPSNTTGGGGGSSMTNTGGGGGSSSTSFGSQNVSSCKSLISKLSCGVVQNPISTSQCESYGALSCSLSEYFNCLESAYVCVNGAYDTSRLINASSCASKAVCR